MICNASEQAPLPKELSLSPQANKTYHSASLRRAYQNKVIYIVGGNHPPCSAQILIDLRLTGTRGPSDPILGGGPDKGGAGMSVCGGGPGGGGCRLVKTPCLTPRSVQTGRQASGHSTWNDTPYCVLHRAGLRHPAYHQGTPPPCPGLGVTAPLRAFLYN